MDMDWKHGIEVAGIDGDEVHERALGARTTRVRTHGAVPLALGRGYSELRAQMISSAESIAHNIAEGRTATSQEEYNRFLDVAARSASEVASQLDMAYEYGIVPQREKFALMGSIICTRRMIRSLQETIRHRERP